MNKSNYLKKLQTEITDLEKFLANPEKKANKLYWQQKQEILGKYLYVLAPYMGVSTLAIIILKLSNQGYPFILGQINDGMIESFRQNFKTTLLFLIASLGGDTILKWYQKYKSEFILENEITKIYLAYDQDVLKKKLEIKKDNYERLTR